MIELSGAMTPEKPRSERFDDANYFFEVNGSAWMRLTRGAAIAVTHQAANESFVVVAVEGGIWQNPGFMSQLDAIWHSKDDPPCSKQDAILINRQASNFIENCSDRVETFILTVPSITGYEHQKNQSA